MTSPTKGTEGRSQVQPQVTTHEAQTVVIHAGREYREYKEGFTKIHEETFAIINQFLTDKERYFCFARLSHGHGKLSKDYLRKLTTVRLCSMPTMSSASLEKIVTLSPNLVKLNLTGRVALRSIQSLSGVKHYLQDLNLSEFHYLLLNLTGSVALRDIQSSSGVKHCLQDLNLSGCNQLVDLGHTLTHLTVLRRLDVSKCFAGGEDEAVARTAFFLTHLTHLPNLCELKITFFPTIMRNMNFPNLLCLELDIQTRNPTWFHHLQYPKLPRFEKLEILKINGIPSNIEILFSQNFQFFSLFPKLKELNVTLENHDYPPHVTVQNEQLYELLIPGRLEVMRLLYPDLNILLTETKSKVPDTAFSQVKET